MMAWGVNCSQWDDSVDMANIEEFNFGEIPEDRFIMTTWHTDAALAEVFWYSKNNAFHPTVKLKRTILLHICVEDKEREMLDWGDEPLECRSDAIGCDRPLTEVQCPEISAF